MYSCKFKFYLALSSTGNIFFVVHFKTPVTIAEGLNNEDTWSWYEVGKGITVLSTEIGELIEGMEL